MEIAKILTAQLGAGFSEEAAPSPARLPAYLKKSYKFAQFNFNGIQFCLLSVMEQEFRVAVFEKHLAASRELLGMPAAFYFSSLTSPQRAALVRRGIPFVAGTNQVYLPFLGVVLSRLPAAAKTVERLSALSQYVLLYFLYCDAAEAMSQSDLAKELALPAMGVSRAVSELKQLGFLEVQSKGISNLLNLNTVKQEIFARALPYLASPIQRVLETSQEEVPPAAVIAGEEALGLRTALAGPEIRVRALYRLEYDAPRLMESTAFCNPDQVLLQLWNYPPGKLTGDGIADPISLYLCYRDDPDERLQKALRGMLGKAGFQLP